MVKQNAETFHGFVDFPHSPRQLASFVFEKVVFDLSKGLLALIRTSAKHQVILVKKSAEFLLQLLLIFFSEDIVDVVESVVEEALALEDFIEVLRVELNLVELLTRYRVVEILDAQIHLSRDIGEIIVIKASLYFFKSLAWFRPKVTFEVLDDPSQDEFIALLGSLVRSRAENFIYFLHFFIDRSQDFTRRHLVEVLSVNETVENLFFPV